MMLRAAAGDDWENTEFHDEVLEMMLRAAAGDDWENRSIDSDLLPHTEFHDDVLEFFRDEIKLAFDDEKLEGGSEPGSLALSVAQSLHEAEVDLHILCQSTKEDVTFILQEIADVDDKEVSRTITVIMEKLARKKKTVKPKVWPLRKKREDDGEPARLSDDEDGAEEGLLPPPPPVGAAVDRQKEKHMVWRAKQEQLTELMSHRVEGLRVSQGAEYNEADARVFLRAGTAYEREECGGVALGQVALKAVVVAQCFSAAGVSVGEVLRGAPTDWEWHTDCVGAIVSSLVNFHGLELEELTFGYMKPLIDHVTFLESTAKGGGGARKQQN